MKEKDIEKAAVKAAAEEGWLSFKFASPQQRGVPDRIFMKDGVTVFVEFKSPRGKLTLLQASVLDQIQNHEVPSAVCRSVEECMAFLGCIDQMYDKRTAVKNKDGFKNQTLQQQMAELQRQLWQPQYQSMPPTITGPWFGSTGIGGVTYTATDGSNKP